jgi:hypothetical protein
VQAKFNLLHSSGSHFEEDLLKAYATLGKFSLQDIVMTFHPKSRIHTDVAKRVYERISVRQCNDCTARDSRTYRVIHSTARAIAEHSDV